MALVLVICCSQQNAPKLSSFKQQLKYYLSFCGSKIWKWLGVILVQGLSGSCSQDISGGCHPQRDFCLISLQVKVKGVRGQLIQSQPADTQSFDFSQHQSQFKHHLLQEAFWDQLLDSSSCLQRFQSYPLCQLPDTLLLTYLCPFLVIFLLDLSTFLDSLLEYILTKHQIFVYLVLC